jgi:hypothetical protein
MPNYVDIWLPIVAAVRERVRELRAESSLPSGAISVEEQPAHTLVVRTGRDVVQASIKLDGSAIEIVRNGDTDLGAETIEIEEKNGAIAYIHDDLDRATTPEGVADMIIGDIAA